MDVFVFDAVAVVWVCHQQHQHHRVPLELHAFIFVADFFIFFAACPRDQQGVVLASRGLAAVLLPRRRRSHRRSWIPGVTWMGHFRHRGGA